jgi:hypothetical protein
MSSILVAGGASLLLILCSRVRLVRDPFRPGLVLVRVAAASMKSLFSCVITGGRVVSQYEHDEDDADEQSSFTVVDVTLLSPRMI